MKKIIPALLILIIVWVLLYINQSSDNIRTNTSNVTETQLETPDF